MEEKFRNLAVGVLISVLSWGVYTVQQLAVSTASLSQSVQYLIVENLPSRVTTLEVVVQEMIRNSNGRYGGDL